MPRDHLPFYIKIILASLGLLAIFITTAKDAKALTIPFRDIILGSMLPHSLEELEPVGSFTACFEVQYWDLLRREGQNSLQDYHQSEERIWAITKLRPFLIGFEAAKNVLTIKQDNLYTESDRMRGGRNQNEARLLVGFNSRDEQLPLGLTEARVLAACGWRDGFSGSISARIAIKGALHFSISTQSLPTKIEITEDIIGYKFPFSFPFRTDGVHGEVAYGAGLFSFRARGSWEVSHGKDQKVLDFENRLYFQSASLGCATSYGTELFGVERSLLRKTHPGSPIPGLFFSIDHQRGRGDLGMYKDDVRYLHLQGLYTYDTQVRFDIAALEWTWISLGWEQISLEHSGDSFFDAWPFSVWDVFRSTRFRLGNLDEVFSARFVGLESVFSNKRFCFQIRGRWEWWRDSGEIHWFERKPVIYPFFFKYLLHTEAPDIRYKYAVEMLPALSIRTSDKITIRLSAWIGFPLGKERAAAPPSQPLPEPSPRETVRTRGGLIGSFSILYSL